ncbi:MAG: oligosaccharide flippase family protein [Candidatus Heimdallarchaeota archaeon]
MTSQLESAYRGSFVLSSAALLTTIAGLAKSVFVFRYIGEIGFGIVAVFLSLTYIGLFISFPGTRNPLIRSIRASESQQGELATWNFLWVLTTTLLFVSLYIILENFLGDLYDLEMAGRIGITFLLFLALNHFRNHLNLLMVAENKMNTLAIANLLYGLGDVIFEIMLVPFLGISGVFLGMSFGTLLSIAFLAYHSHSLHKYGSFKLSSATSFGRVLYQGKQYMLNDAVLRISEFLAVAAFIFFSSVQHLGVYQLGFVLATPFVIVANSLTNTLIPIFVDLSNQDEEALQNVVEEFVQTSTRVILPFILLGIVLARPFYQVFYEGSSQNTSIVASFLIAMAFGLLFTVCGNTILISLHKDSEFLFSVFLSKLTFFLVLIVAVPYTHEIGMAIAAQTEIIVLFACSFVLGKVVSRRTILIPVFLILTMNCWSLLVWFAGDSPWSLILITFTILISAMLIFRDRDLYLGLIKSLQPA